jgi:hypothetical protein
VDRDALMRLMEKNGEFGLHASQALSREFQSAYRDIHDLVLARSSARKLADFFSRGRRFANNSSLLKSASERA